MLKQIKAGGKVIFLSDTHQGHNREFIYGKRNFSNIEEHDRFIRDQWFELIDEETTVFNLGDSHFGDPDGRKFEDFTTWPCKIQYYLWGNHTSGAKQVYQREAMGTEIYPVRVGNVEFVGESLSARINGKCYEMSHFPKRIWDKMNKGYRHISGHSHGSDQGRNVGNEFGKCLDVGVENALKFGQKFFFTFEELETIFRNKENKILDHHL